MTLIENDLLKRVLDLLRTGAPRCYIVGGSVREWLLQQPSKDLDLAVAGAAVPLARHVADETGGAFYVLDEQMDMARVVYRRPVHLTVDFAAVRGPDIIADLQERDFTINAMAVDVCQCHKPQPHILDPCGGQADLAARTLRATSESAFRQDPARLLRALRFAATLSLCIEPSTESWIRRDAFLITRPSAERIRDELTLLVASPGAADHLRLMHELGLMEGILPEVSALKSVIQSAPHVHDVYEHTLTTVSEVERLSAWPDAQLTPDEARFLGPFAADLTAHFGQMLCQERTRSTLLKFAAVLHDTGKSATRSVQAGGRTRFFGHERVGAQTARQVLTRLRFAASEIRLVATVVAHHMQPGFLVKDPPATNRAIYRFFRDAGDAGVDVLILSLADHLAARGKALLADHWRQHLELTQLMLDNYFRRPSEVIAPPRLVTGRDVMSALGLPPGPRVGQLLESVREAQAERQVLTREQALAFLLRFSE